MTDTTATAIGGEEQQVTRFEGAASNQRSINVDHFASGARQVHAGLFTKQITDEAAAVETSLGGAAETVTGTDQGHATFEDAVGQNRKLVRLAAGEVCQFFIIDQLFLEKERKKIAR